MAESIKKDAEWFEATVDEVQAAIVAVRNGKPYDGTRTADFGMRPEQEEAVAQTAGCTSLPRRRRQGAQVSLERENAFWQDFYQLPAGPRDGLKRILVLTYKPVVQTAWKEDLLTHTDFEG